MVTLLLGLHMLVGHGHLILTGLLYFATRRLGEKRRSGFGRWVLEGTKSTKGKREDGGLPTTSDLFFTSKISCLSRQPLHLKFQRSGKNLLVTGILKEVCHFYTALSFCFSQNASMGSEDYNNNSTKSNNNSILELMLCYLIRSLPNQQKREILLWLKRVLQKNQRKTATKRHKLIYQWYIHSF